MRPSWTATNDIILKYTSAVARNVVSTSAPMLATSQTARGGRATRRVNASSAGSARVANATSSPAPPVHGRATNAAEHTASHNAPRHGRPSST
jgi:hypothetical protein